MRHKTDYHAIILSLVEPAQQRVRRRFALVIVQQSIAVDADLCCQLDLKMQTAEAAGFRSF